MKWMAMVAVLVVGCFDGELSGETTTHVRETNEQRVLPVEIQIMACDPSLPIRVDAVRALMDGEVLFAGENAGTLFPPARARAFVRSIQKLDCPAMLRQPLPLPGLSCQEKDWGVSIPRGCFCADDILGIPSGWITCLSPEDENHPQPETEEGVWSSPCDCPGLEEDIPTPAPVGQGQHSEDTGEV